ncbi:MAG TPA: YdcF family protein [Terracidiphilus sp.]|nr:YdcF family protein [Terracidiphilus sp.]
MTITQTRPRRPARKKSTRRAKRERRLGRPLRVAAAGGALALVLLALGAVTRRLARTGNTSRTRFDAIVVLGYPATSDGNPSPRELASVNEAVREYERGVAPRLIFTGAAVANQFIEAEVMARAAQAQGIPAQALVTEPNARDTVQNACYTVRIMKNRGWDSAEVIANPAHLHRAAMIFGRFPIEWRMHAAPRIEPESPAGQAAEALWEDAKAAHYLVWGRWMQNCRP